jgi:hypothetical protein
MAHIAVGGAGSWAEVGARAVTELECQRIERGERPLWGPLM